MVDMTRPLAPGFRGSLATIALPSGAELHRAIQGPRLRRQREYGFGRYAQLSAPTSLTFIKLEAKSSNPGISSSSS
ncbi:hypothetical protein CN128_28580 [Sinorhizobium meliloti]|nr:hypothetical protein C5N13_28815 [Sinorhizobium meliloti]RVI29497.1 hypothetical protein CN202_15495 [Sinorhizobium meliloti]RVM48482.1 hypothetical protein CN128_28580 [Sinorhizobium meliloti]